MQHRLQLDAKLPEAGALISEANHFRDEFALGTGKNVLADKTFRAVVLDAEEVNDLLVGLPGVLLEVVEDYHQPLMLGNQPEQRLDLSTEAAECLVLQECRFPTKLWNSPPSRPLLLEHPSPLGVQFFFVKVVQALVMPGNKHV